MSSDAIKDRLVIAGVRNLKEFGYPNVTAGNILTDEVYAAFFASMLKENLGQGADAEINDLLKQIGESA